MSRLDLTTIPDALPKAHLEVAQRLGDQGIRCWVQGDGLLADMLPRDFPASESAPAATLLGSARRNCTLLCDADAPTLLGALPFAVVTSSDRRRMSLGTSAGPVDLLPLDGEAIEVVLPRFGLSALAFGWDPIAKVYCDPIHARESLEQGLLSVAIETPTGVGQETAVIRPAPGAEDSSNAFQIAPRRYWIAARMLAEYDLDAAPALVEAARDALAGSRRRIPEGAPARRELERVLAAPSVEKGLTFLHDTGLCAAVFPGLDVRSASIVAKLDPDPSLRWAAWLAGTSTQRALRRLRMPIRRAREIERLLRHHPIDLKTASRAAGDAGIKRLAQRLHPVEIEGLLRWRGLELDGLPETDETREQRGRLDEIRDGLLELERQHSRADRIRRLALDGAAVMEIIGRGPGRHVGRVLEHLAGVVAANPEANIMELLEAEVRKWSDQHPE